MRKSVTVVMGALACSALIFSASPALAQEEEPQTHILTITSFKLPAAQAQDFWAVVDKYVVPSDKANPHIISQRMGTHYYGVNDPNVWFVTEYEDLAAIQAADEWSDKWFDDNYPEGSAQRDSADTAFQEKYLPNFTTHTDNILSVNLKRVK